MALLAQAWPAFAVSSGTQAEKCAMACCEWQAQDAGDVCGCAETPRPDTPANLPPVNGRDLLVQVVWVENHEVVPVVRSPRSLKTDSASFVAHDLSTRPQLRLPVLFCSFLN